MIYVGCEGTHTSGHFDICASHGHNLMVYGNDGCAALWMMVSRGHANDARKLWHRNGGGVFSLDQDNLTMPSHLLAMAEFPIFAFEQHLGDLILIPSECAHQVINVGKGYTIKCAWNTTTTESLMHCLESILPVNRRILKPEIFRAKTQLAAVMNGAIKSLESKLWERSLLRSMQI
ncbi:hypothetical protein DSO57_1017053 [Entomophthora muscae]|uniref:Uncharacterized protein n=1 Tax=Entomophthora muscae TaxID=34485 RepID=A0ACC2T4U8_9FUNG|nr:hypothetical protein DSO57_1017053 [Entomophthora muscae]